MIFHFLVKFDCDTIEALLAAFWHRNPDRQSDTPVRVQLLSEKALRVDGEAHEIVSEQRQRDFSDQCQHEEPAQPRAARSLARAASLLQQLASTLRPLTAESEEPELATEGLGLLFN
ncbi:MAG: hypothetical protein JO283_07260 [Bradyrhizobium sp.]|nr:hypothetical protein [Bradyrhizobium sp.]